MARKPVQAGVPADLVEEAVRRITLCVSRRLEAAMREDRSAVEAEDTSIERIRRQLPARARETVDRVVLVRMQLQGRRDDLIRKAVARRHLINAIDDVVNAIAVLSPKTVRGREWHHTDTRDAELIAALFAFMHRFELMPLVNEKRDLHFAEHHKRLAKFPSETFYEHLDELGRREDAARTKVLEPADHDWVANSLRRENVRVGDTSLPIRMKDVAKAMNVSESAQRVRRHRQATKTRE